MPSYLERYRQGEYEQVWAELLAFGGQVREQPLYADALSVAQETMNRARANVELLAQRLTAMGYRFAHPDRVFVAADEETRRLVTDVERRGGPLPLSLRAWCEVVGEVNFMGSHPKLSTYVEMPSGPRIGQSFLAAFARHGGSAPAAGDSLRQSFDLCQRMLNEVVQGIKTGKTARSPDVKAGLHAIKEVLEGYQQPVVPQGPGVYSDPLVVEPYFPVVEDDQYDDEDDGEGGEGPGAHHAIIAPDPVQKTNHSGGGPYIICFPDAAVDALLEEEEEDGRTFIEYLRVCFRWGGFPGLRACANPPRDELAYLTQGLSPL
jgi:hypothetical protein